MENTDPRLTVDAWADIVTSNWVDKIEKLGIGYSFQLEDSITYELVGNSGGLPDRVEFTFKHYGKFVDMGVGKGVGLGEVKDQRGNSNGGRYRRPKPWYSKVMYGQVMKLQEILAKKYGKIGVVVIVENVAK